MSVNESFTIRDLEQCSYRYLQGVAKSLKLPCNVKKIHLINMIFTKKYRPEPELEAIIKQVKLERQKTSQAKLGHSIYLSRNNLQGIEVSSTSPHSPKPQGSQVVIRCSPQTQHTLANLNQLRPLVQSPRRRSDRLLQSANRQNYKYMFNNTVIGLVKSNAIKKAQTQKISKEKKTPVDTRMKYVLNHFKTGIVNGGNALVKKDFNELTIQKCVQNKPRTTQIVVQPNKRQRALSGIYPLNPPVNQPTNQSSYINIRGKDGKLTKINALIQRNNYNVQKYEASNQNICVTVQDIINSNIAAQVKNKYMIANSEQNNKDYPNMFSVTESPMDNKSSIRNITVQVTNTVQDNTKEKTANCSVLVHRYNPVEKQMFTNQIPVKTSSNRNQQYYIHNECNSNEAQMHNINLSSPVTCCNSRRNQPLKLNKKLQTRLEAIVNMLPISRPDIPVSRPEIPVSRPDIPVSRPDIPVSRPEIPVSRPEIPSSQPGILSNHINASKYKTEASQSYQQEYNYTQTYPTPVYIQDNNQTDSTNQWVYNQNHFNAPSYSIDSSGEFYTYYHKKIRARRSISQREDETNTEMLPQIDKVFSKFNDMERDLTKPLYVQVSKESERIFNYPMFMENNHSTHLLENIYNFKNSFITKEPVLQMVTTTSQTNCTYSTPIITTPIAQTPTMVPTDLYASSLPVNTSLYTNNERPCLFDLLKAAEYEGGLQHEFRPTRSSSTSSATSSPANATIPEMVDDAMELISQDGDYMERINSDIMDDVMQCFNCDWTGPKNMFEYHLRKFKPSCCLLKTNEICLRIRDKEDIFKILTFLAMVL